jgi:hypothetical protein
LASIKWEISATPQIYLAESEEAIRKHGELSGIPVTKITEIPQIIDPLTANN